MSDETNIPKNQEIDNALREFEVKSQSEEKQKTPETLIAQAIPPREVEGMGFENISYGALKYYKETTTPKMVKMVIKYSGGAIKDQKHAEYILLAFVAIALIVSGFFVFSGIKNSGAKRLTNIQIEQIIKNQQGIQTP
jgi:hypothetical protein